MLASESVPALESPNTAPDELQAVALDLTARANMAREHGDTEGSRRFLRAALEIMAEDQLPTKRGKQISPDTAKITDLLMQGWQEVAQISELTGMAAVRIHSILAKLRARGTTIQTQTIKRYRIVDGD